MNARPLALAAAALLAFLSSGCAKNRMTLEPYGVCAMPDTCSFSGSCDAYQLGAFSYRPAAGTNWFQVAIELRNQKLNNGEPELGRVNNNDAHVTGTIVEIEGPISTSVELDVGHQTVPADGTAVIWTYLMPPASIIAPLLYAAGTYTVTVSYVGYFDNGDEFETPPFPISVEVDVSAATYDWCGAGIPADCGSLQQSLFSCP